MNFSDEGKVFLISLEGVALRPYLDSVGVKTIGVGSTRSDIPDLQSWAWDKEITLREALDLMNNGLKKYINAVNNAINVVISQSQFDALVSICYNIGVGGLSKSTFVKRINAGDSQANIASAILMWKKPIEILGRRKKEVQLYTNGNYGDGKALLFPVSETTHKPIYNKGKVIDVNKYL